MPSADQLHTFVVPAYGSSPHLRDCLVSLRAQTRPSPIVIATSTPCADVAALACEFEARLVMHGPNAGIGRDWNAALTEARTPWVTVAHQDDVYLPDFVERTLALANDQPSAILILTGYGELRGDRIRTASSMLWVKRLLLEAGFLGRRAIATRASKRRVLRFGCPIPCPSVTVRMDRTGLRFREDLTVNLDWDAWLRLAAADGAFAYSRAVLMLHRIHGDSETTAGIQVGVRAREDLMMFESLWPKRIARLLAKAYALSYAGSADA